MDEKSRCPWSMQHELLRQYHDNEWGREVKDDRVFYEFLLLEGTQAGLNWLSVLSRRPAYREIFLDFDYTKIAQMATGHVDYLLSHGNIIRNRSKIESAITNARAFMKVVENFGSFHNYAYRFMPGKAPLLNSWKLPGEVPVTTPVSIAISKDMKSKGFSFFGPVICYAFMQATGMVNDHLETCFRHAAHSS